MENAYNAAQTEKSLQELWEQNKTYIAENNPGPLFSIDTPPPTVSGSLHIGHVFSYTQADIIARYKRMSGFSVFYPFGFDDNGLATERFVEKKTGVNALKIGRTAFVELCLKETAEAAKQFESLWRRMGMSFDWSKCYSTISAPVRKLSQKSFIELYKKNYIYRKEEPALYCTACRTSVAQAELDDEEKPSVFHEVAFTGQNGAELCIATTRPELLPSCVALLCHPSDTRYAHLKETFARVPLFDISIPVIQDERVIPEKGTGLVMCCTFGDKTDIEWYKVHKLPYKPSIGLDGRMTSEAGFLSGLKTKEAREEIVKKLTEVGLIRSSKPITHAVNIHERCKNEIEYLALPQWFLNLLDYKNKFIEEGDKIAWHPEFMKSRYTNWVENISWDWCLSRQRFYGVPFPVWYCKDCNEVLLPDEKDLPVDPQETSYFKNCTKCSGSNIVPDTDVMDTWNTSSLTPYICRELYTGNQDSFLPMSMRPQAHDIIRTWAFDTIVKSWMHDKIIPWETIVISGHVLSPQGDKISKSQGNSPLIPENLLKLYPADVIRYWTASATLGQDTPFSENQLKIGQKLLIKLWNAFKFVREHIKNNLSALGETTASQNSINQWILSRATQAFASYQKYFEAQEFGQALQAVERFFWHDFCDNYLEIIKDQLFNPSLYTQEEVAETQRALADIGIRILQLFAPYMPHITDLMYRELYKNYYQVESLHQLRFDLVQKAYSNPDAEKIIALLLALVAQVRKLKSDAQVSLKTELRALTLTHTNLEELNNIRVSLKSLEQIIKGVTRAKDIVYAEATHEGQKEAFWHSEAAQTTQQSAQEFAEAPVLEHYAFVFVPAILDTLTSSHETAHDKAA